MVISVEVTTLGEATFRRVILTRMTGIGVTLTRAILTRMSLTVLEAVVALRGYRDGVEGYQGWFSLLLFLLVELVPVVHFRSSFPFFPRVCLAEPMVLSLSVFPAVCR